MIAKRDQDPTQVKNYRPISFLKCDYKLFAIILARRLKLVLKDWIHEDQAGFLSTRQIKDNVRIVLNAIEYFEKRKDKQLAMIF